MHAIARTNNLQKGRMVPVFVALHADQLNNQSSSTSEMQRKIVTMLKKL